MVKLAVQYSKLYRCTAAVRWNCQRRGFAIAKVCLLCLIDIAIGIIECLESVVKFTRMKNRKYTDIRVDLFRQTLHPGLGSSLHCRIFRPCNSCRWSFFFFFFYFIFKLVIQLRIQSNMKLQGTFSNQRSRYSVWSSRRFLDSRRRLFFSSVKTCVFATQNYLRDMRKQIEILTSVFHSGYNRISQSVATPVFIRSPPSTCLQENSIPNVLEAINFNSFISRWRSK